MASENPDAVVAESSKGKEEQLESELSKKLEMAEDSESRLISLISQLIALKDSGYSEWVPLIIPQIISMVKSMDLDSQPKPESKLMSLFSQTISLLNSTDFDSLPEPLSKLISFIYQTTSIDSDQKHLYNLKFQSLLLLNIMEVKPVQELIPLIRQIVSLAISMSPEGKKLILLRPQVQVFLDEGKFFVQPLERIGDWDCSLQDWEIFRLTGEDYATHFRCRICNGEYHHEYEKAPLEIKHPLHPKHWLQLVLKVGSKTRECYCCDEHLKKVFYYCSTCDCAMNIACVEKAPDLSIPPPKWHEHKLALFPRRASLTCNICALPDLSSPIYMCPPCDFVVHQKCINLPRVIRISRHPHRIYHTPSFEEGSWSCSVCRRKIDNDYGGYSCIKGTCSYAAHSRCATQSNVWDGIDLEGEPEEIEEEVVEPFVRISDGIIRHFAHDHHHLRLDKNTCRDYDEDRQCQACITPIYFGNLYSCLQCEFVLHETCAHLSRKLYHPTHPHMFTLALVRGNEDDLVNSCSTCTRKITAGFFYECGKEECYFRLHVQCATISEPLDHASHVHSLFLTSKPEERRRCRVCRRPYFNIYETFNCIECDGFALCFICATLPQKVRYKHDKHILTLSYGQEETSTVTYWCEACERKINPKWGFYMCNGYCCVTLHIECLIGKDLYMKPGSSYSDNYSSHVGVLSNNHHMSRPICSTCGKRCAQKIVFQYSESVLCSIYCLECVRISR